MKYLIFLFMYTFSFDLYGQFEFAPLGAKWTIQNEFGDFFPPFQIHYWTTTCHVEKDTIILNKKCSKIIASEEAWQIDKFAISYFHQEGQKIEFYYEGKFYLWFDFNAQIGDTVFSSNIDYAHGLIVKDIIFDTINKIPLRKFILIKECQPRDSPLFIYEKLGSTFFHPLFFASIMCGFDYPNIYLKCYSDPIIGTVNFDSIPCDSIRTEVHEIVEEPKLIIYPTLVSDHLNLFIDENYINYSQIFSMNGTLMLNPINSINNNKSAIDVSYLIPGIYILKTTLKSGNILVNKFIKME